MSAHLPVHVVVVPCSFPYPPAARRKFAADQMRLDFIHKVANQAATYARRLSRAAHQGDKRAAVIRAQQLRACIAVIGETIDEIEGEVEP